MTAASLLVALVAGVLVVVLVGLDVGAMARRRWANEEPADHTAERLQRLRRMGYLLGPTLGSGTALATLFAQSVQPSLGSPPVLIVLAVPTLLSYPVVRVAVHPYRARVRDLNDSLPREGYWATTRSLAGGAVLAGAVAVVTVVPDGWPTVAATAVLGGAGPVLLPLLVRVGVGARRPTATERDRIGDLPFDDVGVYVVPDRTRLGVAFAAGVVPGLRDVFVTESVFGLLSSDELTAVVAHELGHHHRGHVLLRSLGVLGPGLVLLAAVEFAVPSALAAGVVAALPVFLILTRLVRETEHDADAYAARVARGDALADALELLAARRLVLSTTGTVGSLVAFHPRIADRVARLRGRTHTPPDRPERPTT